MARVKNGTHSKYRHKKTLKLTKGFYGARSRQYRTAIAAVMRSLAHQFKGRKQTKRDYRSLWITRINAACRINGTSYSKFMCALKNADITLNRKMLAEMAVRDEAAFAALVEKVKKVS